MLPEKHNRLSGLPEKLAALEELPDEPLMDRQALWDKLHQRLEKKPRKPYLFLYWAAACALLLIGAAYMQWAKQENDAVQSSTPQITKAAENRNTIKTNTGYALARPETGTKEHKRSGVKSISVQRHNNLQKIVSEKDTALITTIPETALEQPGTQSFSPQDTAQQTLAQAPVKKLKVVHINNLAKPDANKIPVAINNTLAAQTAKQDHQESMSGIFFSGNSSDEIIKIRLTPTN